jgi:hypothetical protein
MDQNTSLFESTVLDTEGRPHPLGQLMAGQASLLVFLRHFG